MLQTYHNYTGVREDTATMTVREQLHNKSSDTDADQDMSPPQRKRKKYRKEKKDSSDGASEEAPGDQRGTGGSGEAAARPSAQEGQGMEDEAEDSNGGDADGKYCFSISLAHTYELPGAQGLQRLDQEEARLAASIGK